MRLFAAISLRLMPIARGGRACRFVDATPDRAWWFVSLSPSLFLGVGLSARRFFVCHVHSRKRPGPEAEETPVEGGRRGF
jgi:hypothetical protein